VTKSKPVATRLTKKLRRVLIQAAKAHSCDLSRALRHCLESHKEYGVDHHFYHTHLRHIEKLKGKIADIKLALEAL